LISVPSGKQEGEGRGKKKCIFHSLKNKTKTQTFKWEAMSMEQRNSVKGMKSVIL